MNAENGPKVEFVKEHQGTQESTFKSLQFNHKVILYTVTQVLPHPRKWSVHNQSHGLWENAT